MKVDLQESHPMPTVLSLWHHHISQRAVGWDILYNVRLNAYIPPNAPLNNYNIHVVDVLGN